ncbi:MAG: cytochrome c, partial [Polyangiaceae bacterium]|nr:cytochrome c [Polyangiaceae bacterium]
MLRFLRRFSSAILVLVVVGLGALLGSAHARGPATFTAPYPELRASTAPSVIARGEYLARGPGHCIECHGRPGETDPDGPLAGGRAIHLPVGTFYVPNLTPDRETGIGRRSDPELARVLREGVRADGHAALPFMSLNEASDDDIVALLSYLRAQPAVRNRVPSSEPNVLGEVVLAYVLEPARSTRPAETHAPTDDIARGRYLVHVLSSCASCHTRVDERTGARIGEELAGGRITSFDGTRQFETPSLRPDPRTGAVTGRSEDELVALFAAGDRRGDASPMPWRAL